MPLSPSTLDDIKSELETLRDLKAKIENRITILNAILVPFNIGPRVIATAVGEVVETPQQQKSLTGTGLRAAILETLKERGPMRSPDIAALLQLRGFPNDSSTPLATRVYNDLWRMSQKDIVKSEMGVFSLVKK